MNRTIHGLEIVVDLGGGSRGMIVVDSTCNDTSSGGVRIANNIDEDEVRALAREMSLKFAFSGLLRGGAKSGICLPDSLNKAAKLETLTRFGRMVAPIIRKGVYYPGMDMNCGPEELAAIYAGAGMDIGVATDTSLFTAMSASEALWAFREFSAHAEGQPVSVMIEGFGNVATHLAIRLPEDKFTITGLSTAKGAAFNENGFVAKELYEAKKAYGDDLVFHIQGGGLDRDVLFERRADIFMPSARVGSLTSQRAAGLDVSCVIPVANAPYGKGAVEVLEKRGVTCLPGFVVNNGGVFASSLYDLGIGLDRIDEVCVHKYRPVLIALFTRARLTNRSPVSVAESITHKRFNAMTEKAESRFVRVTRRLVRERLAPRSLYAQHRLKKFENYLATLEYEILHGSE